MVTSMAEELEYTGQVYGVCWASNMVSHDAQVATLSTVTSQQSAPCSSGAAIVIDRVASSLGQVCPRVIALQQS